MKSLRNIITLMRPNQWVKNLFIFLPIFFDRHIFDANYLVPALWAFATYCFAASSIYCFNDIWDRESDKQHPRKRFRPIASGKVSVSAGYVLMLMLLLLSLSISYIGGGNIVYIILFYYLMNIVYCTYLKQKAIIDVFIIAVGFVLRVVLGGIATGIFISHWIIIMTFLLALFLAFAKRRDDVVIYEGTGVKARKNINRYNVEFMNQAITIVATITIVAYVMYTVSPEVVERIGSPYLYATSVFVMLGMMRYLQLTIVDVKSGSPTKVLMRDRFIQCCIAGWTVLFAMILYI